MRLFGWKQFEYYSEKAATPTVSIQLKGFKWNDTVV